MTSLIQKVPDASPLVCTDGEKSLDAALSYLSFGEIKASQHVQICYINS